MPYNPLKKRKTQQTDIQPVAANRNLERDFFQKVNGFLKKVNAFLEKVDAKFLIGVLRTRIQTHHKFIFLCPRRIISKEFWRQRRRMVWSGEPHICGCAWFLTKGTR